MAVPGGLTALGDAVCDAVGAIQPGPLVVALSGGADSAVAAWACARVRPSGTVRAVYVDHGWEASPRLEEAACAVARKLALDMEILRVEVPSGASPEGTARDARLSALAAEAGSARIVTGHHADDAAETVLVNLLRGAGVTGLSGIPAEREPFVRPLLAFRRGELRSLADHLELPFLDDPSNEDLSLLRNRIRHEVLPELSRRFDRNIAPVMVRTAAQLAAIDAYLEEMTPPLRCVEDDGAILVATAPMITAPRALAARMARAALRHANPPYAGTNREVDAVLAVASGELRRADLSNGFIVENEGPHLAIYRPDITVALESVVLEVPGSVTMGPHLLTARPVAGPDKGHLSHDRVRIVVATSLVIRPPSPGDRIELAGGSKKVSDVLNEAGIPVRKRFAWPVVETRARIAWVAGARVASWARDEESPGMWVELERRTL